MSEKIRGLGYMKVGGATRPFHINSMRQINAFTEVMKLNNRDEYWLEMQKLSTGGALTNTAIMIAFVYSALYAGSERKRLVTDFTYDDVLDWFEDADASEADEFAKPLNMLLEMLPKPEEPEPGKAEGQQPTV